MFPGNKVYSDKMFCFIKKVGSRYPVWGLVAANPHAGSVPAYKKNACHKGKRSETGFERLPFNFLSKVGYSHPASGVVPAVTLFAENGPPDHFLCAQTPSWTRTNDQIGQKQRSPCSLGALRIAPCFFLPAAMLSPALRAHGCGPVNSRCGCSHAGLLAPSSNCITKNRSTHLRWILLFLAPQVGLEPTTLRLTAACSTD